MVSCTCLPDASRYRIRKTRPRLPRYSTTPLGIVAPFDYPQRRKPQRLELSPVQVEHLPELVDLAPKLRERLALPDRRSAVRASTQHAAGLGQVTDSGHDGPP